MPPLPNQRLSSRVPIDCRVRLVAEDRIIAYPHALNLGMGGILVDGPDRLPLGSACGVAILLSNAAAGQRVVARGTVVRSDARGMATAFSKALDPESERALGGLVNALARAVDWDPASDPEAPVTENPRGSG